MKNYFYLILTALAFPFFVSSCASYQKTAPIMGVSSNNINTYFAADVDYNSVQRVEGLVETQTLFGFIQFTVNGNKTLKSSNRYKGIDKREAQALYRAKESSNADIIIDPEFEKESHKYFFGAYRTTKTKVKGWGVNIKGIKEDTRGVINGF